MGLFKSVKKAFKSVENHVKGFAIGKKNCEKIGAYKELKKGARCNSIFDSCRQGGCSGTKSCKNNYLQPGRCNEQFEPNQQSNFLIRSYEKLVSYLMNLLNNQDNQYNQYNQYNYNNYNNYYNTDNYYNNMFA